MYSNEQSQTHGYIGLMVLALFAVAIVAGQARGDLSRSYTIDTSLPTAIELGVLLERGGVGSATIDHEAIRKFRATPIVLDFGVDILALSERALNDRTSTRGTHKPSL